MSTTSQHAICRFCHAFCPIKITLGGGKATQIIGDKDNPVYRGYSCIKGRNFHEFHNSPRRVLHPQKRNPDGHFVDTDLASATKEIAHKLQQIIAQHGSRAVATYSGTFSHFCVGGVMARQAFMDAIGSPMRFNNGTIDQPGKPIAMALHGRWAAGPQPFAEADVCLIVGANPLLSMWGGIPPFNPAARLRDAKQRGLKLIVVDPRITETAREADLHLQCLPGHDAEILAAMVHTIIQENLYDANFVAEETQGFDELADAVADFTPQQVATRAGLDAQDIVDAARLFANAKKGNATGGTGSNMAAAQGTLMEYLLLSLNSLCGRWIKAGEDIPNLGVFMNMYRPFAHAEKPRQPFAPDSTLRVRELASNAAGPSTAALPDEILTPGDGQVRALIVSGGNPLATWPNRAKVRRALESLDLLVVIDPQMSATAGLADYVIGPMFGLELPAISFATEGTATYGLSYGLQEPYAQYQPTLIDTPEGSEVIEDWRFFYKLAQHMNLPLRFGRMQFDMTEPPTTDELIAAFVQRSKVPLETIKQHPEGKIYPECAGIAAPRAADWPERLNIGDPSVLAQLALVHDGANSGVLASTGSEQEPTAVSEAAPMLSARLISSRLHGVYNSVAHELPALARRVPNNPIYMHPRDGETLSLGDGERIVVSNAAGEISGCVAITEKIRPGVIAAAHGFPGSASEQNQKGDGAAENRELEASTAALVDDNGAYDPFSGLPIMSGIDVVVRKQG